jgi:hypothetical protein
VTAGELSVVQSDLCGLEGLFTAFGIPGRFRDVLGLGSGWSREWTATLRVNGGDVACAVRDLPSVPLTGCEPVRKFGWRTRQRHRPGLEFMVSTGRLHGFESLEERNLLLVLDFIGDVAEVLAQPFRFRAGDGHGEHIPDFLAVFKDGSRRAPEITTRLAPENIPAQLPAEYFDQYLRRIKGASPRLIRRTASVRLVQMIAGGPLGDAADFLGLPTSWASAGGIRIYAHRGVLKITKRAGSQRDPGEFDAALEKIAAQITAAGHLIDYRHRRETLRTWALGPQDWLEMLRGTGADPGNQLSLGERERQWASVLVWAKVTLGEPFYAANPRPAAPRDPAEMAQSPPPQELASRRGSLQDRAIAVLSRAQEHARQLRGRTCRPDRRRSVTSTVAPGARHAT